MTSNEQFHELFTPAAWEIFASYLSELKALMEKYQINDNEYATVKDALVNHISKQIVNQKLTVIKEIWIRSILQEIGSPLELIISLGFLRKCRKCQNVSLIEKHICNSCGTPFKTRYFLDSILSRKCVKLLSEWIFSHKLAKITLFILLGVIFGVGFSKIPEIIFLGIFFIIMIYFRPPTSYFSKINRFFIIYFIKGLFLIYFALVILVGLVNETDTSRLYTNEEIIPITILLFSFLLWVLDQPKYHSTYFKLIEMKKKLQPCFNFLWFVEVGSLALVLLIGLILRGIEFESPEMGEITIYRIAIGVFFLVILSFVDGVLHILFLRQYITKKSI